MSSANAIIKIHETENHALDFSSYETGNADFMPMDLVRSWQR